MRAITDEDAKKISERGNMLRGEVIKGVQGLELLMKQSKGLGHPSLHELLKLFKDMLSLSDAWYENSLTLSNVIFDNQMKQGLLIDTVIDLLIKKGVMVGDEIREQSKETVARKVADSKKAREQMAQQEFEDSVKAFQSPMDSETTSAEAPIPETIKEEAPIIQFPNAQKIN